MNQLELHFQINERVKDSRLIIFGTGKAAMEMVICLGPLFSKVDFFIDNFPKSEYFYSKKVYKPEVLLEMKTDKYYILIASSYYKEIYTQLLELGVCKEKILSTSKPTDSMKQTRIVNGVKVGRYTYGYEKHCFYTSSLQEIGSFCSINRYALIGNIFNHPMKMISTHPFLYRKKGKTIGIERVPAFVPSDRLYNKAVYSEKVLIENDVWIGANAVILPGVKIGNGAVIGAGAVVTKDVEDYAIVVGVPAKVIRYRFNPVEIAVLNKVKWWDWTEEEILENIELIKNPSLFFGKFS